MSTAPSSNPKSVVKVAAGLVFRHGHLLITQRHLGDHLGGLWEFPGGKCEAGESYPAALRRELQEELGIEVEVLDRLAALDHTYPEKTVHLEFFRCRLVAKEPQPLGCAQFAWVNREALANHAFPAADARLIDRLRCAPELWRM